MSKGRWGRECRRKFFEARELDPGPIGWVLRQIGKLYLPAAGLLAQIVVSRFVDHLPYCQRSVRIDPVM